MKIPHYTPRRFRAWLAWRCRITARRLDPERPYLLGPFPQRDGNLAWMVMQGKESVAEVETDASSLRHEGRRALR